MSDENKIKALRQLVSAVAANTKATMNSRPVRGNAEEKAAKAVLTGLLGRAPTAIELQQVQSV